MPKRSAIWISLVVLGVLALVVLVLVAPDGKLQALHDANPGVRLAAVRDLDRDAGVDRLIDALNDEDADVRMVAANRLGQGDRHAEKKTPALVEALRDRHPCVRREAALSLGMIGPPAVPALCEALHDADPRVRAGAALALGNGKPKEPPDWGPDGARIVVPALSKALKDDNADVRRLAAQALGWPRLAGEEARIAVPALREALKDHDPKVRDAVAGSLRWLDPSAAPKREGP
jgi:HEAT repeat protein